MKKLILLILIVTSFWANAQNDSIMVVVKATVTPDSIEQCSIKYELVGYDFRPLVKQTLIEGKTEYRHTIKRQNFFIVQEFPDGKKSMLPYGASNERAFPRRYIVTGVNKKCGQ